jgi:hypothetical protein
MKTRLLIGACAASCLAVTASGATPLFSTNPTRGADGLNPDTNDAGITSIGFDTGVHVDGAGGDQGQYSKQHDDFGGAIDSGGLASVSDGLGNRLTGSGHISSATTLGTDADLMTSIAAADSVHDLTATTDAGAIAPS